MSLFLIADDFHERFPNVAISSTGTLSGDVRALAAWFGQAYRETVTGGEWQALDRNDPMRSLIAAAAHLALINPHLREQSLTPPTVSPHEDPMGFMEANAAFLASAQHVVIEPEVTLH